MHGPALGRQQLALRFEAGVRVPELRGHDQAAEGLGAAGVDMFGGGLGGAGPDGGACRLIKLDFCSSGLEGETHSARRNGSGCSRHTATRRQRRRAGRRQQLRGSC